MIPPLPSLRRAALLAGSLLLACTASAATYLVDSISALQSQINAAVAGDTIIVQNGTYTTSGLITINRQGAIGQPIVIKAESVGGVTISGSAGFRFNSPAAYVTLDGFIFNHSGSINIPTGTHHIRLTRNIIELSIPAGTDVSYVNISGDDVEIDHNELRNKSTLGNMLDITGSGSQVARRLWVHHNYFHDFTSPGGNGAETIRWGLSGLSLSNGEGLCEYNLFVRANGENEMISNKSSGNIYRYNTVLDSPGGEISQRHGDNCQYYGNYMRNTAGIRIYGDSHQVHSNYLEGNSIGITIGNGDGDVHAGDALTAHDRPDNCVITFNTLINNATQFMMNGRTNGLGATNTTFANNIIQGGNTAVSISSTAPYTNPVWEGNIVWASANVGNIPAGGYTSVNPQLVAGANGVYHLQAGSPAIGAAVGTYPLVTVDQDGQTRDSAKDVGADEFSSGQVLAKLLTTADVGTGGSGGGGPTGPTVPPINYEAENLAFTAVGGSGVVTFEDSASGGQFASPHIVNTADPLYPARHRFITLNGDGNPPAPNGEYIEFTLPGVPRGTYNFVLRYKTHPQNRAIARLTIDGVVVGTDLNQLASATFTTKDFGVVRFPADGDHVVRLSVVGKSNLSANPTSPWNLTADVFTLVPDSAKPVFTSFPEDITTEATSPAGTVVTFSGTATDAKDGAVPVVFSPASGSTFPVGETVVVGTAQDFAGNIATASFEVTVTDTLPPVLPELPNLTVEATGPGGAVVPLEATAQDTVGGALPVSFTPAGGSTFALGTTIVTASATDASGNQASQSFAVTVVDTTAPVLSLPSEVVIDATTVLGAPANYGATASDLVSGSVPVTLTPAPGATLPIGTTLVTATATDAAGNVATGSFSVTVRAPAAAIVRHAPTLNGIVEGSLQQLLPENGTLNGGAAITGEWLVPGTPSVRRNGNPTYGGAFDAAGEADPSNYTLTLNGGVTLGRLIRRVDAISLPVVAEPDAPAGTRSVAVNTPGGSIGDWTTVRHLTLNGNVGSVAVPAGVYGNFTANGNSGFILGTPGATTPSVYHFQNLTLNGNSSFQVVGPVIVVMHNGVTLNGSMGAPGHAEWLDLRIANNGLTLNGNVAFHGYVTAPSGTVVVNGSSQLTGGVIADRLVVNGNGKLTLVRR